MARKAMLIAAAVLALIVVNSRWVRSQQSTIAVVGGTLIDGTGAGPVRDSVVLIENGKITAVGSHSKVKVPEGAKVIDAKGKYIIPGLIDSHVHFRSYMGEIFLRNGITTVFDFGNDPDWILNIRDGERSGKYTDIPRFYVVGGAINRPGGNSSPSFGANAGTPAGKMPPNTPNGPAWAKQRADAMIAKGVNAVKVTSDELTSDEIQAITTEAHKANLKVIGHVDDVYRYVNAGFDGVVHLWGLSGTIMSDENRKRWEEGEIMNPYAYMEPTKIDPLIKFMLDHHTGLMPMLIAEHSGMVSEAKDYEKAVAALYGDPNLRYVPINKMLTDEAIFLRDRSYSSTVGGFPYVDHLDAAHYAEAEKGYKNALGFTVKYAKAGGLIWLGTDTPGAATVPGMAIRQEVEQLVDGGLSPMMAIQAASKNTAQWFNIDKEVGTLQVGRFGDMVVLDGNPLSDIKNIDKIHAVIKGGMVIDPKYNRDYHPSYWTKEDDDYCGTSTNAPPVLSSVSVVPGANGAMTVVAKGRNFYNVSTVYLNDIPLDTKFMNIEELDATLPADQRPASGPVNVTVRTGWPGGGDSKPMPLNIEVSRLN